MDIERAIETWSGPLVGLLAGWGAPWREHSEADIHRGAPTLSEVPLVRRIGAPHGVDLERVEAFLRRAA
jgi:hypothetical protein